MKSYTIVRETGEIRECPKFSVENVTVLARTKSDATRLFLKRFALMKDHTPSLVIGGGAFNLIHHNGQEFVAESGTIDRAAHPLCIAFHPSRLAAQGDQTFAYYSSDEYRALKSDETLAREASL